MATTSEVNESRLQSPRWEYRWLGQAYRFLTPDTLSPSAQHPTLLFMSLGPWSNNARVQNPTESQRNSSFISCCTCLHKKAHFFRNNSLQAWGSLNNASGNHIIDKSARSTEMQFASNRDDTFSSQRDQFMSFHPQRQLTPFLLWSLLYISLFVPSYSHSFPSDGHWIKKQFSLMDSPIS